MSSFSFISVKYLSFFLALVSVNLRLSKHQQYQMHDSGLLASSGIFNDLTVAGVPTFSLPLLSPEGEANTREEK